MGRDVTQRPVLLPEVSTMFIGAYYGEKGMWRMVINCVAR